MSDSLSEYYKQPSSEENLRETIKLREARIGELEAERDRLKKENALLRLDIGRIRGEVSETDSN